MDNDRSLRLRRVIAYVLEFLVCSFIGWIYEVGLELLVNHSYSDRGVFPVPLLPIYGLGGLLLLLIYRRKTYHVVFIFITGMIITTALELAASYVLERVLGYIPWYYGEWFCNYQGRISLVSSVIFGLFGVLLIKVIDPLCRKVCRADAKYNSKE